MKVRALVAYSIVGVFVNAGIAGVPATIKCDGTYNGTSGVGPLEMCNF